MLLQQLTFRFSPQLHAQIIIYISGYLHTRTSINWLILGDGGGVKTERGEFTFLC